MHYIFGEFSLDTERFELSRASRGIPLQPKAFQLLAYLIAHRGRVVTKEELFAHCWPARIVGDAALNTVVRSIRRALGDGGRVPGTIQTLYKRGYRFMAEVVETDELAGSTVAAGAATTERDAAESSRAEFTREYKQVSVLCCILTDATERADRLGPEVMDRQMRAFFALSDAVLERYAGAPLQRLEDGFMAVFGAPLAQEDHARRAVLAALELRRRLAENRSDGMALPAMGLHSGPVVVGSLTNEPGRPYVAASATTRLARRLQQYAALGDLLISSATWRTVATEVCAEPLAVGNLSAYRVLEVAEWRAGVPQGDARSPTPFVGRERELGLLYERLALAREGRGQIVAIGGEPGIGKSRLLREFRQGLAAIRSYQGYCLPYAAAASYLPVLELVRRICGIRADDPPAIIAEKVAAALAQAAIVASEAAPLLLQLLDVPADPSALIKLSPQAQRERGLACLCELVLHAHPGEPRVIALEDLHWIDAASEQWLDRLAGQIASAPVLLILTNRPEYRSEWLASAPVTRLTLPPLTRQASVDLMRSMTQRLSDELTRAIAARAAGNPFFLEELTRALATTGTADAIPDTVQGVLAARIDRLGAADKRLLQIAAVIGARVPLALWQAVGECPEADIRQALDRLQRGEFLHETRAASGRTYLFKHALTRDVAYQSLLHSARQALHEKTARLIEQRFANSVFGQPEVLAHHYGEAGAYREAAACWQQAGRRSYERSAIPEAIQYVHRGLEALRELPEDDDRTGLELRLLMTLGPALMAARGYADPQVRQTWRRARALCERTGDTAALFKTLIGLWNYHWVRGQSTQAIATARKLLALAQADQETVRLLRAHAALGEILFHTGRLVEAHDHLERGVAHYCALTRHSHATDAPGVACLCYSAWVLWHLGHPDAALARARQALTLARRLEHPFSLAIALCLTAELHQFRLEEEATLVLTEEGVELCREQGFPFWEGTALILWGWALARLDRFDAGSAAVRHGLAVFRATGAKVQFSSWYALQAEVYASAGQVEPGLDAVNQALRWAERTGERYYEAESHRLRGWLLQQCGQPESAEDSYRRALTVAQAQQSRLRELRAAVDLAALWRDQGRTVAARALLQPLQEAFIDGGDWPDLQRARAVLGELA